MIKPSNISNYIIDRSGAFFNWLICNNAAQLSLVQQFTTPSTYEIKVDIR